MKGALCLLFCSMGVFSVIIYGSARHVVTSKNTPPKVEILKPKIGNTFDWNSFIRYSIRVTDAEDGSSEYEEISSKEVFLQVTYIPGTFQSKNINALQVAKDSDPPGLTLMKTSTCFDCHTVKAKLVGPSFSEISGKYSHNAATTNMLAKKIIEGSSGVWTSTVMPPNPHFTHEQSKLMIQWIFENAGNLNVNYYVGTEGSFKTRGRPKSGRGIYLLSASYIDHGLKGIPKSNQRGHHTIAIQCKQ